MVIELGLLYLLVGVGFAAASLRAPPRIFADAALLILLWPLLGPLLFGARRPPPTSSLDCLLPGPESHAALERRLVAAQRRQVEIDALLERPELDPERVEARIAELAESSSSERALASAKMRRRTIDRLRQRRKTLAAELDELAELLAQLSMQSEVIRLTGAPEESVSDLAADIGARLEALECMLEEEP